VVRPAARRLAAAHVQNAFGVSEWRATEVLRIHRSTARYKALPDRSRELERRRLRAR